MGPSLAERQQTHHPTSKKPQAANSLSDFDNDQKRKGIMNTLLQKGKKRRADKMKEKASAFDLKRQNTGNNYSVLDFSRV
jgi:hypothetical protein